MKLGFLDRVKLKFLFFNSLNFPSLVVKFPLDFKLFEKWIIFLPEVPAEALNYIPLIYGIWKKYTPEITIFIPSHVAVFYKKVGEVFLYEKMDYQVIKYLNKEILNKKILILDFLKNEEIKRYIVKKCIWISDNDLGNLVIKAGPSEFHKYLGLESSPGNDFFKIMKIRKRRNKKYVLVDEKKGYFRGYEPIGIEEIDEEKMGFIKEIICDKNNEFLITMGKVFKLPVKFRDEGD